MLSPRTSLTYALSVTTLLLVKTCRALSDEELIQIHSTFLDDEMMDAFKVDLATTRSKGVGESTYHESVISNAHNGNLRPKNVDRRLATLDNGFMARIMEFLRNLIRNWISASGNGSAGQGGNQGDGLTTAEHNVIQEMLNHRSLMTRSVTDIYEDDKFVGVISTTTSSDADTANYIRTHVEQMIQLVNDGRVARQRDPLYAELFSRKSEISVTPTYRTDGVSMEQKGNTDCGAALVKEHSGVVSGFIKYGRLEVRANHDVPSEC